MNPAISNALPDQARYNIPENHKSLVRKRIKATRPEQLLDWDKVKGKFKT